MHMHEVNLHELTMHDSVVAWIFSAGLMQVAVLKTFLVTILLISGLKHHGV